MKTMSNNDYIAKYIEKNEIDINEPSSVEWELNVVNIELDKDPEDDQLRAVATYLRNRLIYLGY